MKIFISILLILLFCSDVSAFCFGRARARRAERRAARAEARQIYSYYSVGTCVSGVCAR